MIKKYIKTWLVKFTNSMINNSVKRCMKGNSEVISTALLKNTFVVSGRCDHIQISFCGVSRA